MPFRQHVGIGTEIRFTRSDHTISNPRPVYDSQQGFESACHQCHQDSSEVELQSIVETWYGKLKPHNILIKNRQLITSYTDRLEASRLLLLPELPHSMAQFSNLSYFIKLYLSLEMDQLEPEVIRKLKQYAERGDDVDLQALALAGLHYSRHTDPDIQYFLTTKLEEAGDQEIMLRQRWGLILDYFGTVFFLIGDSSRALTCYELAVEVLPHDLNIANNLARVQSAK